MKKSLLFSAILLFVFTSVTFAQQRKLPPMNGAMPRLTSTAWTMYKTYRTGNVPAGQNSADVLVFCKVKSWDIVPASGSIGPSGTFKTTGNTLTLINGSNNKPATYKMTWNASTKILKLDGGGVVFEMFFNGISDCDG